MSKLVTIAKLSSPEEALSVRALLESAGIAVFGSDRHYAYLQNLSGVPIIVFEEDVEAARRIVIDAVETAAVPAEALKGRRLSERVKPAAHIVGGLTLGILSFPLWIAAAVAAWWKSPQRDPEDPGDAP